MRAGVELGNKPVIDRTQAGLLALAVAFSAGIHCALVPEHLEEMPSLGYAFIVAAMVGAGIALALVARPEDRRIVAAAGLFCLGQIIAWGLFVSVQVPFFPGTPETIETIALRSKAVEAIGVLLVLGLLGSARRPVDPNHRRASRAYGSGGAPPATWEASSTAPDRLP